MSATVATEMEEGEIVDDVDGLSDISSEEEFLLRQRLEVLENYNNVLERKKAKRSSDVPGKRHKKVHTPISELSEISATDLEDNCYSHKSLKQVKNIKLHNKQRKKNINKKIPKTKDSKKKSHHKRRTEFVISETSDESEDEYKNKRLKLANAVNVNGDKIDKSSLSERLKKMICSSVNYQPVDSFITKDKQVELENNNKLQEPEFHPIPSITSTDAITISEQDENLPTKEVIKNLTNFSEFIDLCSDDTSTIDGQQKSDRFSLKSFNKNSPSIIDLGDDTVDSISKNEKENVNIKVNSDNDSDEDLELLRQNVLKTKVGKTIVRQDDPPPLKYNKNFSDDEDSDTAELRLICLRSALLKKAIEMKQKQKLQKRLSQSSLIQDDILDDPNVFSSKNESKNNTDTESIDMEIVSDEDVKVNEEEKQSAHNVVLEEQNNYNEKQYPPKVDEFEEDEDLLRAKLLTSLSKNLPNLISRNVIQTVNNISSNKTKPTILSKNATEEKKFIIELGESDSEGEHEATKNLTKMHMKLSEQIDFQQKLDMFLKSTRMEVENSKHPVVIQEQLTPKKTEKFVAKAVTNLPKSEQIEYKNLVKRMAELEKIKQLRQSSIGAVNKPPIQIRAKLKNHNVSAAIHNNLEVQISTSRKKIAEESSKMLKLKEEAKKLSQKYKIVATELRNITTAITLNKKQQRTVQNCLTKIRLQHQTLLKSSTALKHSKINGHAPSKNLHSENISKLQKENDPSKDEAIDNQTARTVKFSALQDDIENANPFTSIQVNFKNNKVVIKPKSPVEHGAVDSHKYLVNAEQENEKTDEIIANTQPKEVNEVSSDLIHKTGDEQKETTICNKRYKSLNDYESPLQALGATTWEADPNAILCPFEVAGECKDADCKYLHTKNTK